MMWLEDIIRLSDYQTYPIVIKLFSLYIGMNLKRTSFTFLNRTSVIIYVAYR